MRVGFVAIGRNEGERLRACLAAARAQDLAMVYVDSGSTDGSVALAQSLGADVVALDLSIPFTAARARNEGATRLVANHPDVEFIQFVDGDCELQPGWIARALDEMQAKPKAAVVCGRRRERHPDATVYNALCDMEWATPIGNVKSSGGDALIRRAAFEQVKGYNANVIAGEEPEMCVRLRAAGWEIWRVDAEMTLHDAAMTRFGQWWKRNVRAGHAYAENNWRHGAPPERFAAKQVRSNWAIGAAIPFVLFGCLLLGLIQIASLAAGASFQMVSTTIAVASCIALGAAALPLYLGFRVRAHRRSSGDSEADARVYARYAMLGKVPQALGQLKFQWNRLTGKRQQIIEYK